MAMVFRILIIICLSFRSMAYAQKLTATDTSERSVQRYQSVIRQNRQITEFIEYTLKQRGLPTHLRNLAIIESDLDKTTVSSVGATGIWQFMPEHAQEYGLAQQDRSDIYKSTKTVINTLVHLYNKYGNWITVVAAYNCGEGNVRKAMTRAGSKVYTNFASYLPMETQNHVKKYLNASYATGELNQVLADYYKTRRENKTPSKAATPVTVSLKNNSDPLAQTTLNSTYRLEAIARNLHISVEEIIVWNPDLRKNLAERGESIFYLPRNLMLDFEISRNKILNESLRK